jgi:hypothetical protein
MKLINVEIARATWLFPLAELNPTGKSSSPAFSSIAQRYAFAKAPKHVMDVDPQDQALTFEAGHFKNRDGVVINVKLKIFNDGVVADCWSSTRDAEDFLQDTMKWMGNEFGFTLPPDRNITPLYISQLVVTTDKELLNINPQLKAFCEFLAAKTGPRSKEGFDVATIGFWSLDRGNPLAPAAFKFERKAGTFPIDKRFWTTAALQTEAHMEVLNELERLLG